MGLEEALCSVQERPLRFLNGRLSGEVKAQSVGQKSLDVTEFS